MKTLLVLLIVAMFAAPAFADTPEKGKGKSVSQLVEVFIPLPPKQDVAGPEERLPRCMLAAMNSLVREEGADAVVDWSTPTRDETNPVLTGDLHTDLLLLGVASGASSDVNSGVFGSGGRRNPALAFGMSAVVPGLGQVYNKSWIRAAVAGVLEIGLWTGYFTWRGQGRDGEAASSIL